MHLLLQLLLDLHLCLRGSRRRQNYRLYKVYHCQSVVGARTYLGEHHIVVDVDRDVQVAGHPLHIHPAIDVAALVRLHTMIHVVHILQAGLSQPRLQPLCFQRNVPSIP